MKGRRQNGWTLIELMVATALAAIVLVALALFVARTTDRLRQVMETRDPAALELLREDLGAAIRQEGKGAWGWASFDAEGELQTLVLWSGPASEPRLVGWWRERDTATGLDRFKRSALPMDESFLRYAGATGFLAPGDLFDLGDAVFLDRALVMEGLVSLRASFVELGDGGIAEIPPEAGGQLTLSDRQARLVRLAAWTLSSEGQRHLDALDRGEIGGSRGSIIERERRPYSNTRSHWGDHSGFQRLR